MSNVSNIVSNVSKLICLSQLCKESDTTRKNIFSRKNEKLVPGRIKYYFKEPTQFKVV